MWEVYQKTQDLEFLREMYAVARDFHHFWYEHRDVTGTGLCSWTEGMESGMDDGVRFQSEFAKSVSNASTHVAWYPRFGFLLCHRAPETRNGERLDFCDTHLGTGP